MIITRASQASIFIFFEKTRVCLTLGLTILHRLSMCLLCFNILVAKSFLPRYGENDHILDSGLRLPREGVNFPLHVCPFPLFHTSKLCSRSEIFSVGKMILVIFAIKSPSLCFTHCLDCLHHTNSFCVITSVSRVEWQTDMFEGFN